MSADFLDWYEVFHVRSWRRKAINMIYEHVCADDDFTHCISLGPMSKMYQMLVRWHWDGPNHPKFKEHQERVRDFLWLGRDGMKTTCGADGMKRYEKCLDHSHAWMKLTQIPDNPPNYEKYYRQMNKGGFPFSTRDCGWIVADCTAEGLKSVMYLQEKCSFLRQYVSTERLYDSVNVLYGLEKFWAFLKYSRIKVNIDKRLKQMLSKYKRLEDFRVEPPIAEGAAGGSQPRERRDSGHHPMKKDKKKTSEHSSKDTSRHKGRRSRQASQSENRGEASAPDHGDTTKPMGKRDGHVPKQQAAPSKKPLSSPAGGATSSVSTTKTGVTDKKVAGHSHKSSSESAAQPASG
ncbi:Lanosterol synthase [Lamellibrachia satsuma]|nr:Lanosterol synthase [Lamellibrachia satsuma]